MIECTFQVLTRVNETMERRLWQRGIKRWQDLINISSHPQIPKNDLKRWRNEIIRLNKALKERDYERIAEQVPGKLIWRFFYNLRNNILYFDVESTGMDKENDLITVISTYDGNECKYFVRGENLEDFREYADRFDAVATFDGGKLDFPLINKDLGYFFHQINFDLFKISRQLGLHGGLKELEKRMGIIRPDTLQEVDGKTAIYLWKEYQETGDKRFLETLIAYNLEDAINLEPMLYEFYNNLRIQQHAPCPKLEYKKKKIILPVRAHPEVIEIIKRKYYTEQITPT